MESSAVLLLLLPVLLLLLLMALDQLHYRTGRGIAPRPPAASYG